MLLIDASVWVSAAVPSNSASEASRKLLRRYPGPIWMLDLAMYEVANAVAGGYRRPEEARKLARAMVRRSGSRVVRCDLDLFDAAVEVAAEHGLSSYDAAYVAAAQRGRLQLVSNDHRDLVSKGLAVTPDTALYP